MTATKNNALRLGLLLAPVMLIICTQPVRSVIMPPRFHSSRPDAPVNSVEQNGVLLSYADDDPMTSPKITIDGDGSVDVLVKSQSTITVILDQAIDEDIQVELKVYSGVDLITFDKPVDPSLIKNVTAQSAYVNYKAGNFGGRSVGFTTGGAAGHAEVVCKIVKQPKSTKIDDSKAYLSINIGKSSELDILISVVGWLYFFAWSTSFYFQVVLNYQRKSVVGLNFDFLALNLLGFTCYSIYNFALMFSRDVQKDYYERNLYSRIPVEYNDLFFSIHAFVLTLITVIQCFIYERGEQKVSIPAGGFVAVTALLGVGLYIAYLCQGIRVLSVVLYLSYVKLAITLIKYTPQAYFNYKRKATTGWSIHNILLDFTGGALSLAQMFLLAFNYDDWISIFGNFTKFGLGVISIAFDIVFVTQHYVLYKQVGQLEASTESAPEPVISRSIRSMNQRLTDEEA